MHRLLLEKPEPLPELQFTAAGKPKYSECVPTQILCCAFGSLEGGIYQGRDGPVSSEEVDTIVKTKALLSL